MFPLPNANMAQDIVAKMKGEESKDSSTSNPDDPSEQPQEVNVEAAQNAAFDDAFHAVKKGDLEGFRAAMRAALNVSSED